jgi:hypothetical protein
MTTNSIAIIGLSIIAVLFGIAVLVFTTVVIRWAVQNDFYLLARSYDPNMPAAERPSATYRELYGWTENLIRQRNHDVLAFHYTLGTSCVVVGLLLIAWTVDRDRLRRRARNADTM